MSGCLSTIARRRKAALRALTLAALATGLAGCYVPRDTVGNTPNDYRKRHPIAIREAEKTVHVFIGNDRGALLPEQRIDVMAFANVWRGEATGGVIIDVPVGTPNELASAQAAREIRSLLAAGGIPPHGVTMRPYQPKDPRKLASVRISYSKLVAEAGPCGLWPHDIGPSLDPSYNENRPYWNFGCANQRNLAAMVANPADIVQPRGEANVYTQRRTYVGEQYRRGANSSTNYSNPTKGYLSDVGK